MIVLGIDCSTKWTNVGIADDGGILAEINLELGRSQSSLLPLLVEEALAKAEICMVDIDLIAVANGPGYYTGIRTGTAYGAALAMALRIKVVPLSALELFVYDLRTRCVLLAPVIRAKQSYCYAALYSPAEDALSAVMPPVFTSAGDFAATLKKYPEALLVGADAVNYPELAALANPKEMRGSGFGGQAARMGALYQDSAISPFLLRGNYLRKPDIGSS